MNRRWWRRLSAATLILGAALLVAAFLRYGQPAPPPTPVTNHAFVSAPAPSAPARLWAVGDGADGSAAAQRVASLLRTGSPDRVLYLGDVYQRGTRTQFQRNVERPYRASLTQMAPTPGNHDWPRHRDGYDPFWQRTTGAKTPPWYSFRLGGWQLISINSETPNDQRQLAWVRRELDHARGTCVLAFMHRPRSNAGRHGDAADLASLWSMLQGRAALVVAGHDHNMQRLRPIGGTALYISGAGGHSHYAVDGKDARLAFSNDSVDGALAITLRSGGADLVFTSASGKTMDRSHVSCSTAGPQQ